MRLILIACGGLLAVAPPLAADDRSVMPFSDGEVLIYEIVWPSGLGLGETEFRADTTAQGWSFELDVSADLPTEEIRDTYASLTDSQLCSAELTKERNRGGVESSETVVYDQDAHEATRTTGDGGGESQFSIPSCARDGLTFLYYLRAQLAQGRIPPPDDLNFGAQYQVTLSYLETLDYTGSGKKEKVDRVVVDLGGPASEHSFEILFARDPARTPVLMKIPLDLGTFSLRLIP